MKDNKNHYYKCTELSIKGDETALQELLELAIKGDKTARTALRKTRNKKLLKKLLDEKLSTVLNQNKKSDLLTLSVRVMRKEYLYPYLVNAFREKIDLKEIGFFKNVRDIPLNAKEQDAVKKYIIDTEDFDIRLIYLVSGSKREEILDILLKKSLKDGVNLSTAKIFKANPDYLKLIQPELRKAVEERVEGTSIFATYLELDDKDNQKCIAGFNKISLIYSAIKENIWKYDTLNISDDKFLIAYKLCKNEALKDEEWATIKDSIEEEMLGVHDGSNATKMLFNLLIVLSKYDYTYAEKTLIMIHNRTSLYSTKALETLGVLRSEFAYKEFLKRIIMAQQEADCFNMAIKIITFFPEREKAVVEYVKILDNERLIDAIHNKAQKILSNKEETTERNNTKFALTGKSCVVLDNNTVLHELLIGLAEQINATEFRAAVGFSFESGLRLINPLFERIYQNHGKIELIIGSLQLYGTGRKNLKIDRNSAITLNELKRDYSIDLYTYQEAFYHGKFYYIGNGEKAFVIIGSSNISKTAFLSNYELDILFELNLNNTEDLEFINWFEGFKTECSKIEQLDVEQFEQLDWDSEIDIYQSEIKERLSNEDVRNKISELTDEDTKFRLNTWLEYEPTEIFSNLGVASLDDYIVFLYSGFGLAVFESFVPGNAYYAFRYTDFEKLLNQVASLTKTQMLLNSSFLNRGYHLHDNNKTKEKIALLFV